VITLFACGPTFRPPEPPPEPTPIAKIERRAPAGHGGNGHDVMVGEMCPKGAGGRPGLAPLIMRTVSWSDNAQEVGDVIERGGAPRFEVFGVDGKPAGVFDTMGLAETNPQPIASGTYVGGTPCSTDAGKGQPRPDSPACAITFAACGLAVAELQRADDLPDTPRLATGGACMSGDQLMVDIDGDGIPESFPIAQVLDGIRGPATEWSAGPTSGAACEPSFQVYNVRIDPETYKGKVDPKAVVMLDVMGVVDLDGDGKKELVLALRFPTVRSIVVYGTTGIPQRLELLGEAAGFPR
jgi:hypothetical protein